MTEKKVKTILEDPDKLRWACRRGMLELDVLLGNFLKDVYPELNATDQSSFVRLLSFSDPELFVWLMGSRIPKDQDLAKITEMIRQHARSHFQD